MPIYEYECKKCHEVTEALQKVSDPELQQCPHCGGKVHKMISLNAFHLKGQGWYVTDYAGKNSSTRKTDSTGDADGAKAAPAEKAEKKPEAKAEAKAAE